METDKALQKKREDVVSQAASIVITTQAEYESAVEFTKNIKVLQKEIRATFDPIVDKAHKTHKEAVAQRKKFLDPTENAEKTVKGKIGAYVTEQERLRREEEERLRKLAEKREAEIRRKAEEAAKLAAEKLLEGKGEEAAELQEKAKELVEKAETIEAPKLVTRVDKVQGVSYKEGWDFEIIDPAKVPRHFCIPDEKAIRSYIKSTKGLMEIEGVKIIPKKVTSVRS
jgi:hypothetical protein